MTTQAQYVVRQVPPGTAGAIELFGAARDLWFYQGPEVIIAGPYETGKTYAALVKFHYLHLVFPRIRTVMCRQVYKDLLGSAWVTYKDKVLPYPPEHDLCPVRVIGGEKPVKVKYPNGSEITVAGLENAGSLLSREYDYIYVNQAEEVLADTFEAMVRCTTGRAGNAPYPQILGDCNPDTEFHWILSRPSLKVFHSRHEDNPTLFDHVRGDWTEQGRRTLARLDTMSGVRYKRGRLGLWCGTEGLVYAGFDPAVHVVESFEVPDDWRRFRVFDFGFKHPFVCQWWAVSPENQLVLYREVYHTGRTVKEHLRGVRGYPGVLELSQGEIYEANLADWDAESAQQLREAGIQTRPADKRIRVGVEKVQDRLKIMEGRKPGLLFMRGALVEPDEALRGKFKPMSTVQEISGYVWRKVSSGREATAKDEEPVRVDDHGMDGMRYMVMYLDGAASYGEPRTTRYA